MSGEQVNSDSFYATSLSDSSKPFPSVVIYILELFNEAL